MARRVIIHMPNLDVDAVRWATADDDGKVSGEIASGTLAEAAADVEGKRSVLVLPGNDVLLSEARVPGGSVRAATQAVRYELEEQLADDVDSLHFALGPKSKDDVFPVAVVNSDTMDDLKAMCEEVGLRPTQIVPETLAIPKHDNPTPGGTGWTALVDGPRTVVRLNGHNGFAIDTDMASMALHGAKNDLADDAEPAILVYRTSANAAQLETPADIDVETRPCDDVMGLYAMGLANSPTINLLQGEYSSKTQMDKAWKPWRWTGVLAAVLVAILFGGKWLDYNMLKKQESILDKDIAAAFEKAMPGRRMVRPVSQIRAAMNAEGGGETSGFTVSLHAIADSFATKPDTLIRSLAVRDGRFDLDVITDELETLDSLKAELKKRDLTLTVQSANRDKDGLRSRVRIE